jgi:hypothetical protein
LGRKKEQKCEPRKLLQSGQEVERIGRNKQNSLPTRMKKKEKDVKSSKNSLEKSGE